MQIYDTIIIASSKSLISSKCYLHGLCPGDCNIDNYPRADNHKSHQTLFFILKTEIILDCLH